MAYNPQSLSPGLFPGDIGQYLKGHRVVDIVNLLALNITGSLILHVTGATCTWVESDRIQMKPGARIKVHLQVSGDNTQRVSVRCYELDQVIDSASTILVFNGALFKAKELHAELCLGMRAVNHIAQCRMSRSTLSKVLLMGAHVRNNVWMWCGTVLPSWTDFCTKVQKDSQEGSLDVLELGDLTWASRPEELSEPAHKLLQLQKDSISDAKWRLDQWQEPTWRVEPMKLMDVILADVHALRLASTDSREFAVFTTSMKLFMYMAPADIGKYVAFHLWQYSRPSSAQADEQASGHLPDSSNEPDSPSRSASHDEEGSPHGSSDIEESDAESEELDPDEEDVQDAELQLRHTMAASVRFALGL